MLKKVFNRENKNIPRVIYISHSDYQFLFLEDQTKLSSQTLFEQYVLTVDEMDEVIGTLMQYINAREGKRLAQEHL